MALKACSTRSVRMLLCFLQVVYQIVVVLASADSSPHDPLREKKQTQKKKKCRGGDRRITRPVPHIQMKALERFSAGMPSRDACVPHKSPQTILSYAKIWGLKNTRWRFRSLSLTFQFTLLSWKQEPCCVRAAVPPDTLLALILQLGVTCTWCYLPDADCFNIAESLKPYCMSQMIIK